MLKYAQSTLFADIKNLWIEYYSLRANDSLNISDEDASVLIQSQIDILRLIREVHEADGSIDHRIDLVKEYRLRGEKFPYSKQPFTTIRERLDRAIMLKENRLRWHNGWRP